MELEYNQEPKKSNKWKYAFYTLFVLVTLTIVVLTGLPKYTDSVYQDGVQDGQIALIQQQMATGNIVIINNGTLQEISLQEICSGGSQ